MLIEKPILWATRIMMTHKLDLKNAVEVSGEGVIEQYNIPYLNRVGKQLFMDIYRPADVLPETELPVIVNVHGGGLIMGSKSVSSGFCRLLARRGYLVFSLEYRLVPAVKVYEQLDDVCAGIDCVGAKLVDFNVDFRRIYMVAESAGAYLAT